MACGIMPTEASFCRSVAMKRTRRAGTAGDDKPGLAKRHVVPTVMQKALKKVAALLEARYAKRWSARLQKAQNYKGVDAKFRLISQAGDKEQLLDLLAEFRYAELFSQRGFEVEFIQDDNLPDLRVTREGQEMWVEVMLFLPIHPGPPPLSPSGEGPCELQEYGNPARDVRKALQKIEYKFRQLVAGDSIIAIWNDDGAMEELEVREAVGDLVEDVANGIRSPLPSGLRFVIYVSPRLMLVESGVQQLHCFPLKPCLGSQYKDLISELEGATIEF